MTKELLQQADEIENQYLNAQFLGSYDHLAKLIKALADELKKKDKNAIPVIIDVSDPLPQEQEVHEALGALRKEFDHRRQPLIEHLCRLQAMRIPRYAVCPNIIINPLPQPPKEG